ncbi:hypothetical protein [Polystyrenella longa]|nr:hypothetical protein [Polystyrenella longa]
MFTYPVRLKNYQNDWHITVDGHRNAVRLRDTLRQRGVTTSRLQELDGTSNYSFRIARSTQMNQFRIQQLLRANQQVRLMG